jgi:riboflavin synthase
MFTGIVEEVGTIGEKIPQGAAIRFRVRAPIIAKALKVGDSVSCTGVCLTAETVSPEGVAPFPRRAPAIASTSKRP